MSEGEPKPVNPRSETPITRVQKVAYYANLIAEHHGLDTLTYEALSKYAIANLRVREVADDFTGTVYIGVRYAVYEDEDGIIQKKVITRRTYRAFIRNTKAIAADLYDTYLSKNPASRAAAREVQIILNDEYPKNP